MSEPFGHEKLMVYQTAYKATIQSSALIDLAGGNGIKQIASVAEGRELLRRVAAMLTALSKAVTSERHT
jgi:hypothetical protein